VEKLPVQPKEYVMPVQAFQKVERPRENPNYVGKQHVRKLNEGTVKQQKEPQLTFLSTPPPIQTTRSRN
jgi:hypothetical protein